MKWFHRHGPWQIVGAACDGLTHYTPGGPEGVSGHYFVTHIALRCQECGMIKDRSLRGRFTLEELRGDDALVRNALKYLDK